MCVEKLGLDISIELKTLDRFCRRVRTYRCQWMYVQRECGYRGYRVLCLGYLDHDNTYDDW